MAAVEFWSSRHHAGDHEWLTGTTLGEYLRWYDLVRPIGIDITEIGVGLGCATRELAEHNRVTAVDVVAPALHGLPCDVLLAQEIRSARPADLAICHLVAQHCTRDEVEHLLTVPLRGTLAFQIATPVSIKSRQTLKDMGAGRLHWHDPEDIRWLIGDAGLLTVWERTVRHVWRGDPIDWHLFKAIPIDRSLLAPQSAAVP